MAISAPSADELLKTLQSERPNAGGKNTLILVSLDS